MPSFPVMRGRRARAVSGERVYAACAHAVPRLARGARRGRIVRGARGIARRAEAVASPPLSISTFTGTTTTSTTEAAGRSILARPGDEQMELAGPHATERRLLTYDSLDSKPPRNFASF